MVLLDTHLILWAAFEPGRLGPKASRQLRSREQPLAFSHASLWEVAIKTSLARPGFAVDSRELQQALIAEGFIELPITALHIARVSALPWVHRDPFDRMLVAQAMDDGLLLLTADATLKGYGRFVRVV
jgi:PIN domain nuclease of toxin-antitoxin system